MENHLNFTYAPQGGSNAESSRGNSSENSSTQKSHPIDVKLAAGAGGGAAICLGIFKLGQAFLGLAERVADMPEDKRNSVLKTAGYGALIVAGTALTTIAGVKIIEGCANKHAKKVEGDLYASKRAADADKECAVIRAQSQADIEKIKAQSEAKIAELKAKKELDSESKQDEEVKSTTTECTSDPNPEQTWHDRFNGQYPFPTAMPPILQQIMAGCPQRFKNPMLLALLNYFGTFCFSKVWACDYNGNVHSPNLQLIIEGEAGQGKSTFTKVFKALFGHLCDRDAKKLNENEDQVHGHAIIQRLGYNMSDAMLMDILGANQGVHGFIIESEISTATQHSRQANGLTYERLRLAFDGDETSRLKKGKGANGVFPIKINTVLLGTPNTVAEFIKGHVEDGTASRICWSSIPLSIENSMFSLPSDKVLNSIQNQIDKWNKDYCIMTDENTGEDLPCPEWEVDLSFVATALHEWAQNQKMIGQYGTRHKFADRIASIALHCAITLYMMYGEPNTTKVADRESIVSISLYIATYCMERYLYKFGGETYVLRSNESMCGTAPMQAHCEVTEGTYRGLPESLCAEIYQHYQHNHTQTYGYGRVAERYGISDRQVVEDIVNEWNRRNGLSKK